MKVELFDKRKYNELENVVKAHYNKKLLLLLLSYSIVIYFCFSMHLYKAALFIFLGITISIIYNLYEISLFYKNKVKKITGTCIYIIQQNSLENAERKFMKTNVFFGKCTLYIQIDNRIYEVLAPFNKLYEKGSIINIWYDGSSFTRADGIEVIHAPYIISISPKS